MVAHFASISGVNASPSTPAESTRFDHPSHGSVDDSLLLSLYCDRLHLYNFQSQWTHFLDLLCRLTYLPTFPRILLPNKTCYQGRTNLK